MRILFLGTLCFFFVATVNAQTSPNEGEGAAILPDNFYLLAKNNPEPRLTEHALLAKIVEGRFLVKEKPTGCLSIGFGGWSRHETTKPNLNNEKNPTLDLTFRPWCLEEKLLGGRPFVSIGRTFENSRYGYTNFLSLGNEWDVVSGEYVGLSLGGGVIHLRYEDARAKPGKQRFLEGTAPLMYGSLDFKKIPFSVRVIPLGGNIIFVNIVYHL